MRSHHRDRQCKWRAGHYGSVPAPRPFAAINIESVVYQVTFTRELPRSTRLPARAVYPDRDKVTRA
jgi:hypothetical protein